MWRRLRFCLLALTLGLGITPRALAGNPTFNTIDFPGAASTLAVDINLTGQIVGHYTDTSGTSHGFLLSSGSFSTIDFPGAVFSEALGINAGGAIVGNYSLTGGGGGSALHGYLLSGGTFTSIDFPGAAKTKADGINTNGDIVGSYCTSLTCGSEHGFRLSGGTFTTIDYPNAQHTAAWRINDAGQVLGRYIDATNKRHREIHVFLLTNGSFALIDYPGAILNAARGFTALGGLNSSGDVTSGYCSSQPCELGSVGNLHGFLESAGVFISIDFPGAAGTIAYGINDNGDIVGAYQDTNFHIHGYQRTAGP